MLVTLRGQRIESNFQISIERTLGLNRFCVIMFDEHPLNPSDPDSLLLLPSPLPPFLFKKLSFPCFFFKGNKVFNVLCKIQDLCLDISHVDCSKLCAVSRSPVRGIVWPHMFWGWVTGTAITSW